MRFLPAGLLYRETRIPLFGFPSGAPPDSSRNKPARAPSPIQPHLRMKKIRFLNSFSLPRAVLCIRLGWFLAVGVAGTGCTEKTEVALKVLRDKAENKMLETAGEAEVAVELYRREFASHKEHLVRLKTLMAVHQESLDQAYAANDDRRIQLYSRSVNLLSARIPEAEKALLDSLATLDREKEELRLLKDEIASLQSIGGYEGSESIISAAEKRQELIRELTQRLREKSKRAKALLDTDAFLKSSKSSQA